VTVSHPDPSLLERFLRGELDADERKRVVRHLIGGCPTCRNLAGDLWQAPPPRPTAKSAAKPTGRAKSETRPADYRGGMDRAVRVARERRPVLAAARQRTPELLAELLAAPPEDRLALAQREPRFAIPPLCEEILRRRAALATWNARGADAPPDQARHLVELALVLAERLDASEWGASVVRDLEARAWAHRGDVAREAGLSEEAQQFYVDEAEENEYPLVAGIDPPAGLVPLEEIHGPDVELTAFGAELSSTVELLRKTGWLS
jgi:hypothetical protein